MQNLLYIHGFNSSPQSMKAVLSQSYFALHYPEVNFIAPQLKNSPQAAFLQLCALIEQKPQARWLLIGSSLGGFLSTALAEKYHCKAVLINPAVAPDKLLNDIIGPQYNPYTQEHYLVATHHIDELKMLESEKITKKHYLVMVQTGDEVLDYRKAVKKYQDCEMIIEADGDHSFIGYQHKLPEIAKFFALPEKND